MHSLYSEFISFASFLLHSDYIPVVWRPLKKIDIEKPVIDIDAMSRLPPIEKFSLAVRKNSNFSPKQPFELLLFNQHHQLNGVLTIDHLSP